MKIKMLSPVLFLFPAVLTAQHTKEPEPRWAHQMTYDENNRQVLLYGGALGEKIFGELWAWNGSEWKLLSNTGATPTCKGVFVYDASRKRSVLVTGTNTVEKAGCETWEWDGKNWNEIKIAGPPARVHAVAAYDSNEKQVLLFGGFGNGVLNDTWAFDGKNWNKLNSDGPGNSIPECMYFDESSKSVVLITQVLGKDYSPGNIKNEIWVWKNSSWNKIDYKGPEINGLQAFTSLGTNGMLFVDGAQNAKGGSKTWLLQRSVWKPIQVTGPGNRIGHVIVYDKFRHEVVLFGGGIPDTDRRFNDTWVYNGNIWIKK